MSGFGNYTDAEQKWEYLIIPSKTKTGFRKAGLLLIQLFYSVSKVTQNKVLVGLVAIIAPESSFILFVQATYIEGTYDSP